MKKIKIISILAGALVLIVFWLWWKMPSVHLVQEEISLRRFIK
ncbi:MULTISPECIES: hypothetical protein [Holospora]|nr:MULTISPECIES: hypothetical protein [Holospora]